jgi:anti-anti-sigma factor
MLDCEQAGAPRADVDAMRAAAAEGRAPLDVPQVPRDHKPPQARCRQSRVVELRSGDEMEIQIDREMARISMSGEFTFTDHGPFKLMINEILALKGSSIVIDLSMLEFIDSAGLGMLLLARDEAKKIDRKLILKRPSGQVKRMFGVTKFNTLFTVED